LTSSEVVHSMSLAKAWAKIAVPKVVGECWPGAKAYRVEDEDHPACKLLDRACGIDWLVEYKGVVKGLSVRCQKCADYRYCVNVLGSPTFTIRMRRIGND
jgi:hypothetical protein